MLHKLAQTLDLKKLDEEGEFEGYASTFGNVDEGGDIVQKGAFRKSIRKRMPKMLMHHDMRQPVGAFVEAKEDSTGLYVKGKLLTSIQAGKEALELLRAKAIDGMSIGYRVVKSMRDERTGIRTLTEVELFEISLVTFPMNTQATVSGVKGDWTMRDMERALREAGAPNQYAKLAAKYGHSEACKRLKGQREADGGHGTALQELQRFTQSLRG